MTWPVVHDADGWMAAGVFFKLTAVYRFKGKVR